MSFYRKYRPNNFDQVRGQESAINTLKSIVKTEDIPHAYIFCGGHGIGKTTMARLFAKELGTSDQDVYELDAASNRGIDEARAIREAVYTMPVFSKYKVYILDEAHMLTEAASNALLKTIEEPPAHIIFILCTTDPDKLISTIRSRCQIINFNKASTDDLVDQIQFVAKEEKIKIDKAAAEIIATNSNKSFRDALSNLETIYHAVGKDIKESDLENFFAKGNLQLTLEIIDEVGKKDIKELFALINKSEIKDIFYDYLLDVIRDGMLYRQGVKTDLDTNLIESIKSNTNIFTSQTLLFLLEKKNLFETEQEKKIALMAILGCLVEM